MTIELPVGLIFSNGLILAERCKKIKLREKFGNINIVLTGAFLNYLKCLIEMLAPSVGCFHEMSRRLDFLSWRQRIHELNGKSRYTIIEGKMAAEVNL